jgi:DNA-directed RNA polymerase specialized sigma24 family protein
VRWQGRWSADDVLEAMFEIFRPNERARSRRFDVERGLPPQVDHRLDPDLDDVVEAVWLEELNAAIEGLSMTPIGRRILTLVLEDAFEQYTQREIATELGVSRSTLNRQVERLEEQLRDLLGRGS